MRLASLHFFAQTPTEILYEDVFDLRSNPQFRLGTDLLSGLTVALALVPEAVAFAFVAGVDPLVGLHAAFIVGLITSLFVRSRAWSESRPSPRNG